MSPNIQYRHYVHQNSFSRYLWRFSVAAGDTFHLRCPYIHLPCLSGNKLTVSLEGREVLKYCYHNGDRKQLNYKVHVSTATVVVIKVQRVLL